MLLFCVFACHLTEVRYKHRKIRRREVRLLFLHYGKTTLCHRAADFFVFLGSQAFTLKAFLALTNASQNNVRKQNFRLINSPAFINIIFFRGGVHA